LWKVYNYVDKLWKSKKSKHVSPKNGIFDDFWKNEIYDKVFLCHLHINLKKERGREPTGFLKDLEKPLVGLF